MLVPSIVSVLQKSVADSILKALRYVFDVNGYVVNVRKFVIDKENL
jgi:hypothetical protein